MEGLALLDLPRAPLLEGEVRVWFADSVEAIDPALRRTYLGLLSPEERAQQARFHFQKDRDLYLVAHALLRISLSRLSGGDPRSWCFRAGEHGRPELGRADAHRLHGLSVEPQ